MMTQLMTDYSPAFGVLCLMLGLLYAALLYTKKHSWGKVWNVALFLGRFVLVSVLSFMLLGPYLKVVSNYFEKPFLIFAIDKSQSLSLVNDSSSIVAALGDLANVADKLENNGFEIRWQDFEGNQLSDDSLRSISFDFPFTDISDPLRSAQGKYENQNLAGVVMLTDGIYNQGISPLYTPLNLKVFPVAIGDSLPQNDITLKTVRANKVAFLENKFPVLAEITHNGFGGKKVKVQLFKEGKLLEQKEIDLLGKEGYEQVEFLVKADKKGIQRLRVEVQKLEGEFSSQNNQKSLYIEVLDGKERILLVAPFPHPDIKALRSAIEKNQNYQLDVYIPNFGKGKESKLDRTVKYDLVIFHQVPNLKGIATELLAEFKEKKTAILYILGGQSHLPMFNQVNGMVNIKALGNQTDQVTPIYRSGFERFTFDQDLQKKIGQYPPVNVPFGEISLSKGTDVLLQQRVGTVITSKPLLVTQEQNGSKSAVMLGNGIWQWRLQEYATYESFEAFDALVSKLVQYLSTKEDKRKFRVYTTNSEYSDAEPVLIETEVYNDIYEPIFGQKIELVLKNDKGEDKTYSYVNSRAGFRYPIRGLDPGVYQFTARTTLDGKVESSSGRFTVIELELEAVNTTANFNLLKNLAQETGGKYFSASEISQIPDFFEQNKPSDIIHSKEEFKELIGVEWIFALLLLIASLEWLFRKVKGAY